MTCLLNEEIMAIRNLMSHLQKAIPLESDSGKREHLKQMYKDCEVELEDRLNQCGDYNG